MLAQLELLNLMWVTMSRVTWGSWVALPLVSGQGLPLQQIPVPKGHLGEVPIKETSEQKRRGGAPRRWRASWGMFEGEKAAAGGGQPALALRARLLWAPFSRPAPRFLSTHLALRGLSKPRGWGQGLQGLSPEEGSAWLLPHFYSPTQQAEEGTHDH